MGRYRSLGRELSVLALLILASEAMSGPIVNGDLTGWNSVAFGDEDHSVSPPIAVEPAGDSHVAVMTAAAYEPPGEVLPFTGLRHSARRHTIRYRPNGMSSG